MSFFTLAVLLALMFLESRSHPPFRFGRNVVERGEPSVAPFTVREQWIGSVNDALFTFGH